MTPLRLKLPATSANLGPGFDALGLAFNLFLTIDAAESEAFQITATGRNADLVARLEGNLMLETYRDLAPRGPALALQVTNEIPLGMGCGSSAAALLAGVLLANHFGQLGMTDAELVNEACRREGHPDNVAACFYGGLTASAMRDGVVTAVSLGHRLNWRLLLALPSVSLSTSVARALLPAHYSRADAVINVQSTALLMAAFALDRPDLLAAGTVDRMHQPYRREVCPLFAKYVSPQADRRSIPGIHAITLSGAGPSVLAIADPEFDLETLLRALRTTAEDDGLEIIEARIAGGTGNELRNRVTITRE
jgi:homoserine kinase